MDGPRLWSNISGPGITKPDREKDRGSDERFVKPKADVKGPEQTKDLTDSEVGTIGPGWREDLKGVEEPGCRRKLLEKTEKPSMAKSGGKLKRLLRFAM
ncbi:hypothetical protein AK812_SmicGene24307 [Symbiodinium microadriaticum]|uniref:Uncharacterized protein n=1 Tax=Symbiodinium microadriaticum TaxID=2951 RepID=A0A1Q9DF84_SYMMI|nr:hypothetical protein AK812_SmicGene24307 [Symbiodinium microadriaticum]